MKGKPRRILLQPHCGSNQKQRLNERFGRIFLGWRFLAAYGEAAGVLARFRTNISGSLWPR